jgi:D-3-phosphoglycerate dehydrogenase
MSNTNACNNCYKVLVPPILAEEGLSYLTERGYVVKVGTGESNETVMRELADCHGMLVRTAVITDEVMAAAPHLRVLARHGVGVDNIDVAAATRRGIYVTNVPAANSQSVSEHALAMLLALAKNLLLGDKELRQGNFKSRYQLINTEVAGKTLGIVGLGNVGRMTAHKALHGLDMRVIGYDPYVDPHKLPAEITMVAWDHLFRQSDYISLHLPLTPETQKIVGAREFNLMKPTACFINTARGGLVDEEALRDALINKRIAGAGIDVFTFEPPGDNFLWQLDNVIVSPHNAALTKEATVRMAIGAAQAIHDVLRGAKPMWPVNEPVGS